MKYGVDMFKYAPGIFTSFSSFEEEEEGEETGGSVGAVKEGMKRKREGVPIFAMATAWRSVVHINDADLMRQVCVTKRRNFPKVSVVD